VTIDLEAMMRAQAQNEMLERLRKLQEAQMADALCGTHREPPRKPSRFDGPDVIDLVQGVDGAWTVPLVLEDRVRTL
jgi:hypothetical protein